MIFSRSASLRRTVLVSLILLVAAAQASCSDKDLKKVSQALVETSVAVGTIQSVVLESNRQKFLSDEDTRIFLEFSVKINEAGLKATALTRGINRLDQADRGNLILILKPIVQAIADAQRDSGRIRDAGTKAKIQTALALIQAQMTLTQTILSR
jgi:hypothetical protein